MGDVLAKPVELPIEVMGVEGTSRTVSFSLADADVSAARSLWMRIHKADYEDKIAVQVNSGPWLPLNTRSATLLGLGARYGGFGGGFNTLDIKVTLSSHILQSGNNEICFRFNLANEETLGFRILKLNILDSEDRPMLPASAFSDEDPSTWTAPYKDAASIAEGKRLWEQAPLLTLKSRLPMRATCADCHAHDGRDLKYFNESNYAIRASAIGHGLTQLQANQIASYIRSLNVPNPGRPWNPPYQPGPGLDAKPASDWAAGAGLDSILPNDAEMFKSMPESLYGPAANLNARETPIALQLPDWSRWLPRIHPKDAWGDEFDRSEFYGYYNRIRASLRRGDSVSYRASRELLNMWYVRWTELMWPKILPQTNPARTYQYTQKIESTALWKLVKLWELMQEFELEGMAQEVFGPQAEPRSWYSQWPFMVSPNMQHIPRGTPGIGNGTVNTHIYMSYAWYHLQLILNNGNKRQSGASPIDWPYVYGFVKDLSNFNSAEQAGLQTLWLIKAGQVANNGKGPEFGGEGWIPSMNDPSRLVHPAWAAIWQGTDKTMRTRTSELILRSWFGAIREFTPQQFYNGFWTDGNVVPAQNAMDGNMCDRIWYMLPQFQHIGVDPTLITDIANWAKNVWPRADWEGLRNAHCATLPTGEVRCSVPVR